MSRDRASAILCEQNRDRSGQLKGYFIKTSPRRSMDRTLACEAENLGSTPNEDTKLAFLKDYFLKEE